MTPQILDGRLAAQQIEEELKARIKIVGIPTLAVILVGDNPASHVYVTKKQEAAARVGIRSQVHRLSAQTSAQELRACIQNLNHNTDVHGILLQLPLPAHLNANEFLSLIHPDKDVDGLNPVNMGRLVTNEPGLRPCTPQGIVHLLKLWSLNLAGKRALVIGRSRIVGLPISLLLLQENCTVTVGHRQTQNVQELARDSDIIVACAGVPQLVTKDWIKPGACVIDVGIHRLENGKLVGDVMFDDVAPLTAAITPVPGGVGPMTVAYLLKNTLQAYEQAIATHR